MPAMPTPAEVAGRLRAAGCVFAEDEAAIIMEAAATDAELASLIDRRVAGEPLEVIVGWAEFAGLRIAVESGVFVPRRRTELLAREAIAAARPGCVVVDLCCGSGAIGAAVAASVPSSEVFAADVDPVAVRVARRNLPAERVFEGDLFAALPSELRGRVAVLAVNAPYVPTDEIRLMPPEAREREPLITLDGGGDGLDVHRRIAAHALEWLAPGGTLVIEVAERQVEAALELFAVNGLRARILTDDELDATVVVGIAP
ncbi:putative protein N(5)-glutamine methyltransferase [Glaciibacter flavus]|uniref:putative protein N(5)-glutamine methyltransferase n=1 Tax=Orlajensenia flava TaxID=2565934 RepID=UPI003B008211